MQGLHLTADLRGCQLAQPAFTDPAALRGICLAAVRASGLLAVGELFHRFPAPGGVTGVVLLAESHLAVHTWPELAAVTLDVYVCNLHGDNGAAAEALLAQLSASFAPAACHVQRLQRGQPATAGPASESAEPARPAPTMQHLSLQIIHDEHQALAAMLRSMSMLLSQARRDGVLPDFGVLRAMLFYVDEFPERLHHPKETELLFPRVRANCPDLRPVLDRLEREHHAGELAIRDLEHTVLAFEVLGEPRRQACEGAVERYVSFYLEHMGIEEDQILPAARQHFDADDWAEIDAAFAANRDPLTGHEPDDVYRPLFRKILMNAPAPIGLGPAQA